MWEFTYGIKFWWLTGNTMEHTFDTYTDALIEYRNLCKNPAVKKVVLRRYHTGNVAIKTFKRSGINNAPKANKKSDLGG